MVVYRNLRKTPRSKIKTVNAKKRKLDKLSSQQLNLSTVQRVVDCQNEEESNAVI